MSQKQEIFPPPVMLLSFLDTLSERETASRTWASVRCGASIYISFTPPFVVVLVYMPSEALLDVRESYRLEVVALHLQLIRELHFP